MNWFLKAHGPVLTAWCAFLLAGNIAFAHAPFESSTRAVLREETLEVSLTVGTEGGALLLKDAPAEALRVRTVGPAFSLPVEFGGRWFEVTSDGTNLAPKKVEARTDGLEVNLFVEYPRPAGNLLEIRNVYVRRLPASYKSSFALTDEMGNVLGARIISQTDFTFTTVFHLPEIKTNALDETSPAESSKAVAPSMPPARSTFSDFLKLGVEHIFSGYDHLLFLLGLLLGCRRIKPMLVIITCFTLAHSVTLALAALNLVVISPRVIEPLIAVTIMIVGIENLIRKEAVADRYWLAGGFGLIHGFGFAGALREAGMVGSGTAMVVPLFSFNLGVEIGQLVIAAIAVPALFFLRKNRLFSVYGIPGLSIGVILGGGYWLIQRANFGH